jgi:subtilisin family serine protease
VTESQAWRSAFEDRQAVSLGERMIVVLAGPSLADRIAAAGEPLSAGEQRRHVRRANALQVRLLAALRAQGIRVEREHVFTRTLNGFSARLGARAFAALQQAPGVAGIYPVRAVYPAGLTAGALERPELLARHGISLPGADGSGVTVALLDTGVDRDHPSLRGRVLWGIDLVEGDSRAEPEPRPDDPSVVETHGTRIAGIVAGAGGPNGLSGVAPGAQVLPIRVLDWREGPEGYQSVGSGDVLLAGLERAVDPDGDGDVEDAADLALAAVVEPYASFADSPESRAVAGALALGTLVVAPAGNDGSAAEGSLGTIGAPGAASAALAVGAADTRPAVATSRVTIRSGDQVVFDGEVPLLGGVPPPEPIELPALLPAGAESTADPAPGASLGDFAGPDGSSLVEAGIAVLRADGDSLLPRVENAAAAGARAVLVYGSVLSAGGLGYDEQAAIPVFSIPGPVGAAILEARLAGAAVTVTAERATAAANAVAGEVAAFSSHGPSAATAKPDVVAPGVALVAPDATPAGADPRYAAVTGTSVAAAVAAGAAALVLDLRPDLGPAALAGALVGSARSLAPGAPEPATAAGAGLVDPVAAASAGLAVEPSTVSFGRASGPGWNAERTIQVRNVSGRALQLSLGVTTDADSGVPLTFAADPATATVDPGATVAVRIVVSTAAEVAEPATVSGAIVVQADGVAPARVPWAVAIGAAAVPLVSEAELSRPAFAPSRRKGAVLTFRAGAASEGEGGVSIDAVGLLDVELETARGRSLGVVSRLRDLLPGTYAVRITGRNPSGRPLRPGRYVLVLRAWSADAAEGGEPATVTRVPFRIVR